MTDNKETNKKIERPRAGGGRPGSKMGMPAEKVKDFKGTLRRLLKYVGPHKFYLILILFCNAIIYFFPKTNIQPIFIREGLNY